MRSVLRPIVVCLFSVFLSAGCSETASSSRGGGGLQNPPNAIAESSLSSSQKLAIQRVTREAERLSSLPDVDFKKEVRHLVTGVYAPTRSDREEHLEKIMALPKKEAAIATLNYRNAVSYVQPEPLVAGLAPQLPWDQVFKFADKVALRRDGAAYLALHRRAYLYASQIRYGEGRGLHSVYAYSFAEAITSRADGAAVLAKHVEVFNRDIIAVPGQPNLTENWAEAIEAADSESGLGNAYRSK